MIRLRYRSAWTGTYAALLLGCSSAAADTCPCPKDDLATRVNRADVIFVGKVLSATADSTGATQNKDGQWRGDAQYQTRLMLDVSTVLKGKPPRFVEVVTPIGPCGFMFAVGKAYLVSGTGQGATVTTDLCQGNVTGDAIDDRVDWIEDLLHPKH